MSQEPREYKTYAQKMRRADKEALYSVVALGIIVVAWIVGGVGLSALDLEIASTPVWIIGGTVGPWLVAVIIAVVFAKRIFANFSLDDEEGEDDATSSRLRADAGMDADVNAAVAADEAGDAR